MHIVNRIIGLDASAPTHIPFETVALHAVRQWSTVTKYATCTHGGCDNEVTLTNDKTNIQTHPSQQIIGAERHRLEQWVDECCISQLTTSIPVCPHWYAFDTNLYTVTTGRRENLTLGNSEC
jgi:hypothetical protein